MKKNQIAFLLFAISFISSTSAMNFNKKIAVGFLGAYSLAMYPIIKFYKNYSAYKDFQEWNNNLKSSDQPFFNAIDKSTKMALWQERNDIGENLSNMPESIVNAGFRDIPSIYSRLAKLAGIETQIGEGVGQKNWIFFKNKEDAKIFGEELDFMINQEPNLSQDKSKRSKEYKIHLMPNDTNMVKTVALLLNKIKSDRTFAQYIAKIKVNGNTYKGNENYYDNQKMPRIVLYCALGKENAQSALNTIYDLFKNQKNIKDVGVTPRFNQQITDLIYYAQGNSDDKNKDNNKEFFEDGSLEDKTGKVHYASNYTNDGAENNYHLTIPNWELDSSKTIMTKEKTENNKSWISWLKEIWYLETPY